MGKAQDDEARPVAAQAPRRGAPPRAPSPGPTGKVVPAAGRGRAPDSPPRPAPAGRLDPPRPGDTAAAPRAPSPLDAPCTRGRRVGPPAGSRVRRARPARIAGPLRAARGLRRPACGRPLREPLAPLGRARHGWGAGLQWAHIGGGRLSGAPDSVPQGPDQPRSGRLRKPVPPQPRYGLRRALVLGGVLLILLLFVVAIVVGYLWVRNTIRSQDEERAAAQVHTVYPTPGKCDPSTLKSTVQGPESVGVGAGATFSISLVNSGQAPCLIDVGSQALGVRVTSGSQQVWDSVTCPVGQTEKALLLPAGKGADVTVTWNGNAATSDCAAANAAPASPASPAGASASSTPSATASSSASPSAGQAQTAPGSAAGAGTYRFRFVMGDKDLSEDRVFVVG